MDATHGIEQLRNGDRVSWPSNAESLDFARDLDRQTTSHRDSFIIPTKGELKRTSLADKPNDQELDSSSGDPAIYFCGNSLGLQAKAVQQYVSAYLQTWSSIAVGGHFTQLKDSPLAPFQDMAAQCSRQMVDLVGAKNDAEVVVMNTLTVNLHLMMAAFYRPEKDGRRKKILLEWRPFPSDYYAIESQIEWHGFDPEDAMLKLEPDQGYCITTEKILSSIDEHADELALILLPGIQYYSGQLLDIPTITKHAQSKGIIIGWDLAHAAGNVELKLHDWNVDFACWCTYKYMNAGAGAIGGVFIHEKHGNNVRNRALKGWYGHDKSSRFLMDNKFDPTPGAQGFQLSNPSVIDLTCLSAALSIFDKTTMKDLRSKSLLLTAYAEQLLKQIAQRTHNGNADPFEIITPSDPLFRGAQLSLLLQEELFEGVASALPSNGIVCDKRKPGVIRVAPAPLYNTFEEVWKFMEVFESALANASGLKTQSHTDEQVEARL